MSAETLTVGDDMIRSIFERWQRLEEEKQTISEDLKELFAEAKGNGFDTKALRAVFRDMTKDRAEAEEFDAVYDLYWSSLNKPRAHPAHAHIETLNNFPPHDAVTGELTEEQESTDMVAGLAGPACAQDAAAANTKPARNPAIALLPDEAGQTGDEAKTPLASSPVVIPDYVPTFLIKTPAKRPHCRRTYNFEEA